MYNIIPLILICACLFIILIIIVRKFPALANLDVDNMPAEKEARFKEQIITGRLQKGMAKWKIRFGRFFGFWGAKIAALFKISQEKLQAAKNKYSSQKTPLSLEDKEKTIKELLLKNEILDDRENFEAKEGDLIKVIELDPRSAKAFIALGGLYLGNKKYEEAKQALGHALKLLGNDDLDRQAEVYYDLAEVYEGTGELDDSLETAKMAVKLSPNNPRYLDALVEISIINKDKTSASEALERLAAVNPENGKLEDYQEQIKEIE
jgi:tetratricopeptide (TPR) repeat protein